MSPKCVSGVHEGLGFHQSLRLLSAALQIKPALDKQTGGWWVLLFTFHLHASIEAGPGEDLGGPALLLFSRLGFRLNLSHCLFALCIASPQQHAEHREDKLTETSLLSLWEGLRVGLVRLAAERPGCTVSSTGSPSWAGRLPHLTSWRLLHKLTQPQELNPRRWRLCLCSLPFAIPTSTTYVPDAYQILRACSLNNKWMSFF